MSDSDSDNAFLQVLQKGTARGEPKQQERPDDGASSIGDDEMQRRIIAAVEATVQTSRQYGRRANPDYVQLNANIPRELKHDLRVRLMSEGRTIQEVVEKLVAGFMAGDFEV